MAPDTSVFYIGESYEYQEINTTKNEYVPIYIKLSDKIEGNIYASVNGTIYCIGKVDKDNHDLTLDYNTEQVMKKDFSPSIALYKEENLKELHNKLSENIFFTPPYSSPRFMHLTVFAAFRCRLADRGEKTGDDFASFA